MIPRVSGTLGKYEIQGTLGQGAFGIVYYGWQTDLQRPVAIKELGSNLVGDPAFLQQFRHAQNAGQRIIELVREAADHLSHGREALALNNLLLQLLLHRHVANGDDHARRFAFGIQEWTRHAQHRAPSTVAVPGAVFA